MRVSRRAFALPLIAALVLPALWAGETPAPCLEFEPGPGGAVSWWLVSPPQQATLNTAQPPRDACDDAPLAPHAAERWKLSISPTPFSEVRPEPAVRKGAIWFSAVFKPVRPGTRVLHIGSYCAASVFKDGQLLLKKAEPAGPYLDEAEAQLDVTTEPVELTVGVEIRSGWCGFQLTVGERQAGAAKPRVVGGDRFFLRTAPGKTPDPAAALLQALSFQAQDLFLSAEQSTPVLLGLASSRPCDLGPLQVRFKGPDGKPLGKAQPDRTAAELALDPWRAEFALPAEAAFQQNLTAEVSAGDKALGTKTLTLYSIEGLAREADDLSKIVTERAKAAGHSLPNAALAAEKLQLSLHKIQRGEERLTRSLGTTLLKLLTLARTYTENESAGKDPFAGQTGYLERAYTSRIDEQPQPYFCMVPQAFSQAKAGERFPLVIFLHGYVPSYDKDHWWEEMPEFNALIDRHNAFLAIPFARSNTDFQSCGEVDVLDVIAEMKRLYPIDDDRVYLYGYSMGGMGVYTIGAHFPELFAAGVVFCGRADSPLQNFKPLETFAPYKQWLIQADNPISLCENFLNVPLRIYHGKADMIIDPREAVRMEQRLKEIGCDASLTLYNGDHWTGFDIMATDAPLKWLLEQKRTNPPAHSKLKAYNLRHANRDWPSATGALEKLTPAVLEWDGAETPFDKELRQAQIKGIEFDFAHTKYPQRCGPVREAICGPFLIAYGTTGDEAANALNKSNAQRFAKEWYAFTRSRALIKADKDVTEAEKQTKNLFLFGEAQQNSIHAAIADKLPIRVKDGQITLAEKKVPLDGKGVMFIYPSPFGQPNHSVVICAGIPYGQSVGINHKLDLVPDFLIYNAESDTDGTGTNHALCAGFFDGQWKLNPKTTWWEK